MQKREAGGSIYIFFARRQIEGIYAIAVASGYAISWKRVKQMGRAELKTFRLKLRYLYACVGIELIA